MKAVFKLAVIAPVLTAYLCVSKGLDFLVFDAEMCRSHKLTLTSWVSRICLWILGVRVVSEGARSIDTEHRNYLIVANHLSYLDVLAIAATVPGVFVTSIEVKQSGFLGWLAHAAGAIFVERRKRSTSGEQVGTIASILERGFNVILFPEGTSTSGESVLPFKKSLLHAAVDSVVDVLPVCVNYTRINGEALTKAARDSLFYYGEMEFLPHLKRLLSVHSVEIQIKLLPYLKVRPSSCRKTLAEEAHSVIATHYVKIA